MDSYFQEMGTRSGRDWKGSCFSVITLIKGTGRMQCFPGRYVVTIQFHRQFCYCWLAEGEE